MKGQCDTAILDSVGPGQCCVVIDIAPFKVGTVRQAWIDTPRRPPVALALGSHDRIKWVEERFVDEYAMRTKEVWMRATPEQRQQGQGDWLDTVPWKGYPRHRPRLRLVACIEDSVAGLSDLVRFLRVVTDEEFTFIPAGKLLPLADGTYTGFARLEGIEAQEGYYD